MQTIGIPETFDIYSKTKRFIVTIKPVHDFPLLAIIFGDR